MKRIRHILLAPIAAVSLGALTVACGNFSSDGTGGSGGSGTGGTGGTSTATGGTSVATGGISTATGGSTTAATGGSTTAATGGNTTATGGTASGGASTASGGTGSGGASTATGGSSSTTGGSAAGGSSAGSGGSSTGTGGSTVPALALPGDVLNKAGNKVVSAHSTVRVIVSGYSGPLYQLCKGSANPGPSSCKGTPQDISAKAGYADSGAHDTFCPAGSGCTITKIYDQSGQGNDLEPAPLGGAKRSPDNPASASALPVTVNGHAAYGVLIKANIGYRTGCNACNIKTGKGMALGDEPQTMYWITSQKDLVDGCCFDYGNAETTSNDDGNGTMETIYFGGGVVWGTGYGGKPGPWVMADLENGLYAGWENNQDKNISTNTALKFDFVTNVVLGDTKEKNGGKGRFALYGGDATTGTIKTMYDGIRPAKPGYVPMQKQGSIILGIGGDNSNGAGGRFYEGIVATGPAASKETVDALQAAIVAANYGK